MSYNDNQNYNADYERDRLMVKTFEREGNFIFIVSPETDKEKELIKMAKECDLAKQKEHEFWHLGKKEKKGVDATVQLSFGKYESSDIDFEDAEGMELPFSDKE